MERLYKQDMNKGYYRIITNNFKLASSKKIRIRFVKIINLILNKIAYYANYPNYANVANL